MSTETDDLIRDVQALVASLPCGPQPRAGTVLIQAGTKLEARLRDVLGAPSRLRRTRVGRWVIDGRTYRTKALALASVQKRAVRKRPALMPVPVNADYIVFRVGMCTDGRLRIHAREDASDEEHEMAQAHVDAWGAYPHSTVTLCRYRPMTFGERFLG